MLFVFDAAAMTMVWLLLPETVRQRAPEPVSFASIFRSYRRFLADWGFVVHLGIATCCLVGLFAWISSAAFVLQDMYGLSPFVFGLAFAIGSAGYLVGTAIAARFVMRWGSQRTMGLGTVAMALGGVTMSVLLIFAPSQAAGIVGSIALYTMGMGMALAQAQAGALLPFPDRAGAASSLLGFVTQTVSAVVGAILGHALGMTAWPLAIAMLIAGGLSLLLWWTLRLNASTPG
jgi:DHA1 family bicyclomycin/chloramphenicol resistance-like MFS transporter